MKIKIVKNQPLSDETNINHLINTTHEITYFDNDDDSVSIMLKNDPIFDSGEIVLNKNEYLVI